MRLSIVPEGKRFVPSPAKPRASGFTGNGATPSKTPAKSSLSKTVGLEAPEEYDELLAVEEGDEGDKLFLERKEEENAKVSALKSALMCSACVPQPFHDTPTSKQDPDAQYLGGTSHTKVAVCFAW